MFDSIGLVDKLTPRGMGINNADYLYGLIITCWGHAPAH